MEKNPVPVVCIIVERKQGTRTEVLIQKRWKPASTPNYVGFYEIPGGKILASETIEQAVKREALEETGLEVAVKRSQGIRPSSTYRHRRTMAYGFSSPWCSQEIGEHSSGPVRHMQCWEACRGPQPRGSEGAQMGLVGQVKTSRRTGKVLPTERSWTKRVPEDAQV